MPTQDGSIRLFRFAGITVFIHWSWFLIAVLGLSWRKNYYSSLTWNIAEYLALFGIVLMHEFGHSLACRQVGGKADKIVLWPLGGVAFVDPPQRPGPTLWSIAAGPLVNVALVPVTLVMFFLAGYFGWESSMPDFARFIKMIAIINGILLVFNLLPIYPLDGGQILRSILWFFLGRAKSLTVTTVIGFAGVGVLAVFAIWSRSMWNFIMAGFVLMNCWSGFQYAQALSRLEKIPRRTGFACPSCHAAPQAGMLWRCGGCKQPFDPFATGGQCPQCFARFEMARCADCGATSPVHAWVKPETPPPIV